MKIGCLFVKFGLNGKILSKNEAWSEGFAWNDLTGLKLNEKMKRILFLLKLFTVKLVVLLP